MSRWLRCLICLFLICCILVNCSPLRAEATGAGVAAATITGAATVTVSAPIAIGAAVIALGIAAGTNDDFQRLVESAVSNAGDWVKDGTVELLQTVNSAGEKAYYVAGEMMDDLRSWVFDTTVVYSPSFNDPFEDYETDDIFSSFSMAQAVEKASLADSYAIIRMNSGEIRIFYASGASSAPMKGYPVYLTNKYLTCDSDNKTYWRSSDGRLVLGSSQSLSSISSYRIIPGGVTDPFLSDYDVSLGYLPSSDTTLDDKTVVTFHPYLAHVLETRQSGGSGGSGDDGNNNKWWLRLALGASAAAVYATTQQQQIENPSTDIQEITFGVQFDVTDTTEEDQKKILYVSPQTGTIPGTGTNPGTGTDPGGDSGSGGNTGTDTGGTTGGNSGWVPPSDHSLFALGDLSKFFPFCIPFDLFDFFTLLNADPVAPVFSWEIEDLSGQTYSLTIDLAEWDPVALLFRRLQLFLFICGLAAASRKFIKW